MDSLLGAAQQALAGQQQQQQQQPQPQPGGGPNWFALITTVLTQSQAQPGSGQQGGLGVIL
ncbi:MAG: hypothetical protein ABW005_13555, partial [Burkholderiaceae bacterium]